MKKLIFLFFMLPLVAVAGEVAVTSVTAQQRYPWNGLVDITVTIQGTAEEMNVTECSFVATNSATKAEILVAHVTCNGAAVGSGSVWTRKYIWDAKADVGAVKIDDLALSVDACVVVQLWKDGPYWAECNVGAKTPEEYGYYFWWGDTVGYKLNASNNRWVSVKDGMCDPSIFISCPTYGKSNPQLQSDGYIDASGNLVAAHDAATAHLGALWRMPTEAEFSALIDKCDTEWTSRNGVSGRLVKGRGAYASRSIFLPAAGYGYSSRLEKSGSIGTYWSSTPGSGDPYRAWYLSCGSDSFCGYNGYRLDGLPVRPVLGFAK